MSKVSADGDAKRNSTDLGVWGSTIDKMHEDPMAPRILHKVPRDGCCLPAICLDCCGAKKRSYLWIMESGIEQNDVNPCAFQSCARGRCCSLVDSIHKVYFDQPPFSPGWLCFANPPYCAKRGVATEHDLNYCCWCINCLCLYDCCYRPCCGGVVAVTCCNEQENPCCYKLGTRCCNVCAVDYVMACVKDSKEVKPLLLEALRNAEARKQGGRTAPSAAQMSRP